MKKARLPKADYFRSRYADAVENGLTSKAAYYKSRLEQMSEPLAKTVHGGLTRADFGNGLVIFAH